ncbi:MULTISPECIES: nickel-dependent hydrogenase large subunit [Bradyrhizobium]|uniref:nickel-dependent hydrogenase large subunit n=1 Tax=Bradyrhizobium TaxID=374 RepID=UPI001BA5FAAA|nr:nickel-dependent hydrogenase large subunit [Bradyrhizobium liaoningense]MBR0985583.1 nickel-dependent hydrogenase large subunit [Bradyrhizobium liaoningense]GMO96751.1 nickel-dependent hydrogenase large subunit [Bradyrhizobium sp. TM239]
MTLAFRNEIDITVWLAGSTIADVAIQPRSRPPLTRLFAGKPAASLLPVLPRLFSLCSVAHQVAFLSAIEAAQGLQAAPAMARNRVTAVVAERLTELLRSLFVGRLALDGASAASVRAMMQATTVLGGASEGASEALRCEAVVQIKAALAALGIAGQGQALVPGSALAVYVERCEDEGLSPPSVEQSFLTAADDLDIVTRLLAGGPAYSDAPELCGKIPETGVWARARCEPALPAAGAAARLEARIAEVARLCVWLDQGDENLDDGVVASYRLGAGRAAAAVECARGRLYHAVVLDEESRIVNFEFLAPTEWNFHARGPLVRSLKGAMLAAGRRGQDAVRTLVGAFDPCVGFNLNFREVGHA